MSDNLFFARFQTLCQQNGTSPNAAAKALGIPSGSVTAWKQGALPRSATLQKLAAHFDVTVDYLMGKEEAISDEALKFALFGGDGPSSDEMLQEVRQFAQYLKSKNQ